jgi:hypothetical protein
MQRSTRRLVVSATALFLLTLVRPGFDLRASCDQIDPVGVLPDDAACPGWTRDGEPMTAYTLEELMMIIDGAAVLYAEYGFVAAAFQNYAGFLGSTPATLTLSAFNQGTAENARALYLDPDSGTGDPVTAWGGTGAARVRVTFGYATLQFWEECYFVSIVVGPGDETAIPEARCIAEATLPGIQGTAPVATSSWGALKAGFR